MTAINWADFGQLGTSIVIVYLFLQHIDKKDAASIKIHQECEVRIAAVAAESKKLAEKCLAAFLDNSKAIVEFKHALEQIRAELIRAEIK